MRRCGRLSNQWNVWLKESNTNAKGVPEFFSNKDVLKQHQCEPQIKKEKCPYCSKTINRANNLEKHLRSCEKAPTYPSKQPLHQTTLNGSTALENGPSTPKKLILEEVQVSGAPAGHAKHWKAHEIVESAFKGIQQQQHNWHPAAIERGTNSS